MSIRTVAVLGAGHGGCAAAADLGRRGFAVRLHTRNAERLDELRRHGGIEARGIHAGLVPIALTTTDLAEAVDGADLIMLVVPSVAHEPYARALAPLIDGSRPIFLNPGHTGGGLHFLAALRHAGYRGPVRSCETVTLTYITRLEGPATVNIYSYTNRLRFAALPGRHADELFALIEPLYPNILAASSVLETGLGNINAIFHPPGMMMNAGWLERTGGDFLFYREGFTPAVGRVTAAVDAERMAVARALGVPAVPFLDIFYEAGLTTREARDAATSRAPARRARPTRRSRRRRASITATSTRTSATASCRWPRSAPRPASRRPPWTRWCSSRRSRSASITRATASPSTRLGLAGKSPAEIVRFAVEGDG